MKCSRFILSFEFEFFILRSAVSGCAVLSLGDGMCVYGPQIGGTGGAHGWVPPPAPHSTYICLWTLGIDIGLTHNHPTHPLFSPSSPSYHTQRARQIDGPYRNQDETIELALNLNLDPRKPGQALRGSCSLPHGTGKTVSVVVFTNDAELAKSIQEQAGGGDEGEGGKGSVVAGGENLISDLADGTIPLTFDRALATPEIMSSLAPLARLLGPRGLMPNAKVGTIVPPSQMMDTIKQQQAGQIHYRTDKAGIVHAGVAKGSFDKNQIVENVQAFMNEMQEVKPESFGKGKKKGGGGKGKSGGGGGNKNAKYYLKAHVSSTQGKGVPVDLRTVDPTSTFFMGEIEE